MAWLTVEEMASDLGLRSDPNDMPSVLEELKNERAKLHPDHFGGQFPSEAEKERYYKIDSALEFCQKGSQALVPLSTLTALVREISKSIAPALGEPLESRIAKIVSDRQAGARSKFRFQRISLTVLSAALGFVFFFPQQVSNHPFVPVYISSAGALALWSMGVFILVWSWIYVWLAEQRMRRAVAYLFSLDHHRSVLGDIRAGGDRDFSRSQLRSRLCGFRLRQPLELLRTVPPYVVRTLATIDTATADEATDVAVTRYLEREWIRRIKRKDIDEWFEILV